MQAILSTAMVLSVNLYGEQEAADPSRGAWPLPAHDH